MIKTILFIVLLQFFCWSCVSVSQKKDEKDILYIIPHHQQETFTRRYQQDFSILFFYGQFNFVLTDNQIFLHQRFVKINKNEKINFTKPPQLKLLPTDFTEIRLADLPTYLSTFVLDTAANNRTVMASVVANSDTIKNPAFNTISNFFQSKNHFSYVIRNWTEEEQFALKAKIFKTAYNPDTMHWKVGFGKAFVPVGRKKL